MNIRTFAARQAITKTLYEALKCLHDHSTPDIRLSQSVLKHKIQNKTSCLLLSIKTLLKQRTVERNMVSPEFNKVVTQPYAQNKILHILYPFKVTNYQYKITFLKLKTPTLFIYCNTNWNSQPCQFIMEGYSKQFKLSKIKISHNIATIRLNTGKYGSEYPNHLLSLNQ